MENTNNEDVIKSKSVVEVITIASEFCLFIDKIDKCEFQEAISFLQKILPALYLKGALLPAVPVEDDSANERFVTEEEYETLRYRLSIYLGDNDYFPTIDLKEGGLESITTSLSELLSDIYTDLKDFLLLYTKGSRAAQENAVAACYCYFHDNWGMRLAMALPQIHLLAASNALSEEEFEG